MLRINDDWLFMDLLKKRNILELVGVASKFTTEFSVCDRKTS